MENISSPSKINIALVGGGNIDSSDALVNSQLITDVNQVSSLLPFQEISEDLLIIDRNNKSVSLLNQKSINEISSEYEDANSEQCQVDFLNSTLKPGITAIPKASSSTIFENAVKAVKNLFSPVKGHGMFARSSTALSINLASSTKLDDKDDAIIFNEVPSYGSDQMTSVARKLTSSPSILEILNEEDLNTNVIKNCFSTSDNHNNTNDSYITTVSRMDDSFQSTVTHFDDCGQTEKESARASVRETLTPTTDISLNETLDGNDNSLNKTLKKSSSSCSLDDEKFSETFEVSNNGRVTDLLIQNRNNDDVPDRLSIIDAGVSDEMTNVQNCIADELNSTSGTVVREGEGGEKVESDEIVIQNFSRSVDSVPQEILVEAAGKISQIIASGKETMSDSILCWGQSTDHLHLPKYSSNGSFISIADDNQIQLSEDSLKNTNSNNNNNNSNRSNNNNDKFDLFVPDVRSVDSIDGVASQSSETDCSIPCGRSDPDKTTGIGLEKNFSTSTIIISKEVSDSVEGLQFPLRPESTSEEEIAIMDYEDIDVIESSHVRDVFFSEQMIQELNGGYNIMTVRVNSPRASPNQKTMEDEKCIKSPYPRPILDDPVKIADFINGNLNSGLKFAEEPKSHVATGIPLASQKSYTVLHHNNPELNRPFVADFVREVPAEKINDIILGNSSFSENVLVKGGKSSEDLESQDSIADTESNISLRNVLEKDGEVSSLKPVGRASKDVDFEPMTDSQGSSSTQLNSGSATDVEFDLIENVKTSLADETVVFNSETKTVLANSLIQNEVLGDRVPSGMNTPIKTETLIPNSLNDTLNKSISRNDEGGSVKLLVGPVESNKSEVLNFSGFKADLGALSKWTTPSFVSEVPALSAKKNCSEIFIVDKEIDPSSAKPKRSLPNLSKDFEMRNSTNSIQDRTSDEKSGINSLVMETERLSVREEGEASVRSPRKDLAFELFGKCGSALASGDEAERSQGLSKTEGNENELSQFIQEQFTAVDIEKICNVVDDMPELNLSKNIVMASQQFDKSIHSKIFNESRQSQKLNEPMNNECVLTSACLDFLDSISGKSSGRDYSRESLYVKFDPLVTKHASEGDKENLILSNVTRNNAADLVIPVSPLKPALNSNSPLSPLTPTSQKIDSKLCAEKVNRFRELQSEILRLREFYSQREIQNKEKMMSFENEISTLTKQTSVLEDKLKESEEREKSVVKRLFVQNESINRLKKILEEYLDHISKLTDLLEASRMDSQRKISALNEERDFYMNHLQNTESAFSDLHSKYEMCKKAVEVVRKNEEAYKNYIENLKDKVEEYSQKVKDVQEVADVEVNSMREKMSEMKSNHAQEISRFRVQLKKMELKVHAVQEALDRKVQENQELSGLCDELIEAKK